VARQRASRCNSSCIAGIAGIAIGAGFGVADVATFYAVMSLAMMPVGYVVAARLLAIPMRRIAAILASPLIATSAMIAVFMAVVAVMRQDG
jgi:hypothetical protein